MARLNAKLAALQKPSDAQEQRFDRRVDRWPDKRTVAQMAQDENVARLKAAIIASNLERLLAALHRIKVNADRLKFVDLWLPHGEGSVWGKGSIR
jgi:hypothetical protein